MGAVRLVLAIHNHQPVGNFDSVIEDAYHKAYAPFLQALERHPAVRFVLHQPGILWEWMQQHHPEYLDTVQRLVERGQVELLSGGYYEPIFPVIPEADRIGQIRKLTDWLHDRFGVEATGGWLAERVWEPHLAESLARAGLRYAVVDDSHFLGAGHRSEELDGYFVTEENGHLLRVFPIRQRLRYTLPFAEPEETLEELRQAMHRREDAVLVHADDGEKFGVWPGTHELCYDHGWMDRFLETVEENVAWLRTVTFRECLEELPPRGRTYLPTASYAEMMEWALPPAAQRSLQEAHERVGSGPEAATLQSFVRGGFWRNFLSRYPESNWMHKKMLAVSRKRRAVAGAGHLQPEALQRISDDLWAGQCNCAYWHGLFGGLYLPHLRSEIYRRLIRSEVALDAASEPPAIEETDFDADGANEVILRSDDLLAIVQPHLGGAVFELDDRRRYFNVLDLMGRREEAYHERLRQFAAQPANTDGDDRAVSIHDRIAVKEEGLERRLVEDTHRRGCCIDHVLVPESSFEAFCADRMPEAFGLVRAYYEVEHGEGGIVLETEAIDPGDPGQVLRVRKALRLRGAVLEADYTITAPGAPVEYRFGIEMAANLLAGDAPDRRYEIPERDLDDARLLSQGILTDIQRVDLVDEYLGLRLALESSRTAELWRFPVESISMSEAGFERVYQGSSLLFVYPLVLRPGMQWRGQLTMSLLPV
jgi:alpha-amylase